MSEKKFTEEIERERRIGYVAIITSVLNILLLLQTVAALWGIRISVTAPKITRAYLLQYEYYIRWMVTVMLFWIIADSYVYSYYRKKYGTNPPRWYAVSLSAYVFFVSLMGYYLYQIWTFLWLTFWSVLSLTYYLTLHNPYLEEIARSDIIKRKE
jgi:hypothetical protein